MRNVCVIAVCTIGFAGTLECEATELPSVDSISLAGAVQTFNDEYAADSIGEQQPPLTEEELLKVIHELIDSGDLSLDDGDTLKQIEKTERLPKHVTLRRVSRYDDGKLFHHVAWVRLTLMRDGGSIQTYPVRAETLFDRPYTQKEREFKQRCDETGGIPVLNRLAAYFDGDPQFGKVATISKNKSAALADAAKKALAAQDVGELLDLYDWEGVADDVRKFANGEMQQLLSRRIVSVTVAPKRFGGKLRHWQGFKTFDPNLPVVGYLVIETTAAADEQDDPERLSLELGMNDGRLRLVNYIETAENAPKKIPPLSTRGHLEPLGDGFYEMSWTCDPPGGPVVSAMLANEEVWRMKLGD